jgi:DNA-directed RNA polymerase subunit RPC12/RpoP
MSPRFRCLKCNALLSVPDCPICRHAELMQPEPPSPKKPTTRYVCETCHAAFHSSTKQVRCSPCRVKRRKAASLESEKQRRKREMQSSRRGEWTPEDLDR